jgi:hypothetical protein
MLISAGTAVRAFVLARFGGQLAPRPALRCLVGHRRCPAAARVV